MQIAQQAQENNLKTLSIRYFGRRLSTNNPCQVSRLWRFVTKQEMEGETCFISLYNEVLCLTNRCDNITVLDTLSPSPKWLWLLLKFLHLPSGWEHWKNGAKNLFSDTSGAFFCLHLLPLSHPVPGTKHSPTNQLSLAGGMKSAGAVPSSSPGSAQPGLVNPPLHVERESQQLSKARLCAHVEWHFWTVTVKTLPTVILLRSWQTELDTLLNPLCPLVTMRSPIWFWDRFLEGHSKWRSVSVHQWHQKITSYDKPFTGLERSHMSVGKFSKNSQKHVKM